MEKPLHNKYEFRSYGCVCVYVCPVAMYEPEDCVCMRVPCGSVCTKCETPFSWWAQACQDEGVDVQLQHCVCERGNTCHPLHNPCWSKEAWIGTNQHTIVHLFTLLSPSVWVPEHRPESTPNHPFLFSRSHPFQNNLLLWIIPHRSSSHVPVRLNEPRKLMCTLKNKGSVHIEVMDYVCKPSCHVSFHHQSIPFPQCFALLGTATVPQEGQRCRRKNSVHKTQREGEVSQHFTYSTAF